jgi:hypothetical protein
VNRVRFGNRILIRAGLDPGQPLPDQVFKIDPVGTSFHVHGEGSGIKAQCESRGVVVLVLRQIC